MLRLLFVAMPLMFLASCSHHSAAPTAGPASATIPIITTTSDSATPSDDPAGLQACSLLKQSITDATLMDPGVVEAIAAASTTADAPVSDAAGRLQAAYTAALAASGAEQEPDAVAAVSQAGAEMHTVCTDAGLDTVG